MTYILTQQNGNIREDKTINYLDFEPFTTGFFYLHFESGKIFYRHIELSGNIVYVERTK